MMKFTICLLVALTIRESLSMVASRSPMRQRRATNNPSTRIDRRKLPFTNSSGGVTTSINKNNIIHRNNVPSSLISQLACMALKRRLKSNDSIVSCDLTADPNTMLFGRVGPVTVKGRRWESPLGLTCRAIEATVAECQLDMGRVLSKQKLVLTTPAEGTAMIALSSTDFGNFITHPLMKPPSPPQVVSKITADDNNKNKNNDHQSYDRLIFLKEDVSVDPSSGQVTFFGTYFGATWKFSLQRVVNGQQRHSSKGGNVSIQATRVESSSSEEETKIQDYDAIIANALTATTSKFFNEMIFELDGTFLSFDDMMVTGKGSEPSVMLSLRIKVKKFPSPGLEF